MTLLITVTVGFVVGNLYYIQLLLGLIADNLGLSAEQVGAAATLVIASQACGRFLITPLGDSRSRRPLILASVTASIVSLLAVAGAQDFPSLIVACLALRFSTTGTHQTISLAASVAPPEERGRVVGAVVGGLLQACCCCEQ